LTLQTYALSDAVKPGRKVVRYRRVSTVKQGISGLGQESQDAMMDAYCRDNRSIVIATFDEIETAKKDEMKNRPELVKAIAQAKRAKAVLLIAKFDRLSRSVYVTSLLLKENVEFIACDNPHASKMNIQMMAVMAEYEAKMISDRTKAALQEYKRGKHVSKRIRLLYPDGVPPDVVETTAGKLGGSLPQCCTLTPESRARGVRRSAESRRAAAIAAVEDLAPRMMTMWRDEKLSLRSIANRLNDERQRTRTDSQWSAMAVKRVLDRARVD
jgi:DNA invertase Pin-like site-specific DNA recombinase